MGFNDYNLGQEGQLDLVDSLGNIVNTYGLTEWDVKQIAEKVESLPIVRAGKPVRRTIYKGWQGTLHLDRYNSDIDILADMLEDNYYAGLGELYFRIMVTERDPETQMIEQWIYNDVCVHLTDGGKRKTDEKVVQTLSFYASDRKKVL